VHGLFLGDAAQRLRQAGAKVIVATNTIESEHSRVSVADVVVQALAKPMTARR
jgi:phosphoribosylpyrophosphate synthetase